MMTDDRANKLGALSTKAGSWQEPGSARLLVIELALGPGRARVA